MFENFLLVCISKDVGNKHFGILECLKKLEVHFKKNEWLQGFKPGIKDGEIDMWSFKPRCPSQGEMVVGVWVGLGSPTR